MRDRSQSIQREAQRQGLLLFTQSGLEEEPGLQLREVGKFRGKGEVGFGGDFLTAARAPGSGLSSVGWWGLRGRYAWHVPGGLAPQPAKKGVCSGTPPQPRRSGQSHCQGKQPREQGSAGTISRARLAEAEGLPSTAG